MGHFFSEFIFASVFLFKQMELNENKVRVDSLLQTAQRFQAKKTKFVITMRAYIFLVVIFATIYTSWAGVMVGAPNKGIPVIMRKISTLKFPFINICNLIVDYLNKCYVRSIKEAFAVGKHTPKGKCMQVLCRKDFSYEIKTYVQLFSILHAS